MNLEILGLILLLIVLNTILLPFIKSNTLACGLIGFSGKGKIDLLKLKLLLFWNSVERGRDATGIYTPESGIVKDNEEARKFFNNKNKFSKIKASNLLIGHVRAKTVGTNSVANAHPFEYGNLVGAHNGSLKNHWQIARDYKFNISQYDVDSQVLISALNENHKNNDQGDFQVLSEYEGAAALLVYNKKENILYACHDNERPLFYGYINGDMYISSIKDTLSTIECEDITEFPINTIHLIRDGEILHTINYEIYKPKLFQPKKEWALSSDITIVNGELVTIDPKYSGLSFSCVKPKWLVGYYVQLTSNQTADKKLTHSNWYLVEDYVKTSTNGQERVIITNDEGDPVEVTTYQIDTNNFIPAKGNICKMMYGVINTKTKKTYAEKGDIVEVLDYKYGQEVIRLKVIETGSIFTMDFDCVRNMADQELNAAISLLRQEGLKESKTNDVRIQNLLGMPTCDIPEYPFQDPNQTSFEFNNQEDVLEDAIEIIDDDEEELMMPYSTYLSFVEIICDKVNKLDTCVDNFNIEGITAEVEELKDICVGAMEIS